MKKFLVFIISFALLSMVFQILTGLVLTALYTPDISSVSGSLRQEVAFGNTSVIHSITILLTAALAYFISHTSFEKSNEKGQI